MLYSDASMSTSRLKRWIRVAAGRDLPLWPEVEVERLVLGSEYGAHCVGISELGPESVVYSFGVGEDVSMDVALIERFGMTVHAFDPTPRSIEWVKKQDLPDRFVMHPLGVADYDGTARFRPPMDPTHISHTLLDRKPTDHAAIEVEVKRLVTIMGELGHDRLDVLKMDVEGAEYEVIEDLTTSGVEADQVLVEFHHHLKEVPLRDTREAVAELQGAGYRIFHVSPTGREYSFIHERAL